MLRPVAAAEAALRQRSVPGQVAHRPWPLEEATGTAELNTMAAPYGLELSGSPLLHFSERQDAIIWNLEPVS
jgi:hypothetical protein